MKILIPIFSFAKSGGMRVLSQLANYWIDMGNEVDFVSYCISDKPYYPTNAKIRWINENGEETQNLMKNKYKVRRPFLMGLKKYLKKNSKSFDVVLANHNAGAWTIFKYNKSILLYTSV